MKAKTLKKEYISNKAQQDRKERQGKGTLFVTEL